MQSSPHRVADAETDLIAHELARHFGSNIIANHITQHVFPDRATDQSAERFFSDWIPNGIPCNVSSDHCQPYGVTYVQRS